MYFPFYITIEEEDEDEEDAIEGETPDEIHTESSGEEDEIAEQASSQQLQQDIALKDTLAVSQSNPAPSLPSNPLVNTPTTAKQVTNILISVMLNILSLCQSLY